MKDLNGESALSTLIEGGIKKKELVKVWVIKELSLIP